MINLPKADARTTITGSTGSGKTVFATWLLSLRDYNIRPWYLLDFKGEKLFNKINAQPYSLGSPLPKEPGIYHVKPLPGDEHLVSEFFRRLWERENSGVLVDETYMVPKLDRWFRACLTQGRSKHVEMIMCTQRPKWLDTFVFTETTFFSVHNLNYLDDRKHLAAYLDGEVPPRLVNHQSLWYDVAGQKLSKLAPVPPPETLVKAINVRLEKRPVIL